MAFPFIETLCTALAILPIALQKTLLKAAGVVVLVRGIKSLFDPDKDSDPNNNDEDAFRPPSIESAKDACVAITGTAFLVFIVVGLLILVLGIVTITTNARLIHSYKTAIKRLEKQR